MYLDLNAHPESWEAGAACRRAYARLSARATVPRGHRPRPWLGAGGRACAAALQGGRGGARLRELAGFSKIRGSRPRFAVLPTYARHRSVRQGPDLGIRISLTRRLS